MRRAMAFLLVVLAVGGAPPAAGGARLRCDGAFRKSCVRSLYRCFDGAGACRRDLGRFSPDGIATDCWENGTRAIITGFDGQPGTSTLVNRRGRSCLRGTTAKGNFFGGVEITYARGRRRWIIVRDVSGTFTVTCPSGRSETYTEEQIAAGGCGPVAACGFGTCP